MPGERDGSTLIPGEYDATTLTHREPGAIGGRFNGDDLKLSPGSMDSTTAREHEREGGRPGGGGSRTDETGRKPAGTR
jgi:hypothetical protein